MSERIRYQGSCHCGRVSFELEAKLDYVMYCNCSLCRRVGALWHGASDASFRITGGEEELLLYQFNTMVARHYSCRHCGIHPFSRPRLDPGKWAVNVRCIDAVDVSALPVIQFDGANWEEAARALHAARNQAGSSLKAHEKEAAVKITVEALVKVDLDAVWAAWNNPEDIKQWNAASDDWHTTHSTVDLREGGKFSARMEAKDGSVGFDFEGTYTRVVPRKLIEYRMDDGRTCKVEFVDDAGGVLVRETFDAETENAPELQRQGWQAILDNFAGHVEGKGGR